MKRSLASLWHKFVGVIVVGCAILIPRFSHAEKTQQTPSFSERAQKVKKVFDQTKSDGTHSIPAPRLMQWGNWPNWQNWQNWGNWSNWNNWGNWGNF